MQGSAAGVRISCVVLDDPSAPPRTDALLVAPAGVPGALPPGVVAVVTGEAGAAGSDAQAGRDVVVITLPAGADWAAVVWALHAEVSGKARRADARDALRGVLVAGGGAPGIAQAATEMLGGPVAILDEYLEVLGTAAADEAREDALADAIEAARTHGPASLIGPFLEAGLAGAALVRLAAVGVDDLDGVLVVWGDAPAPDDPVLAAVADALLVERRREDTRADTEARLRGELIEELLAGEVVSRESLVRRARHLGADLTDGAIALVGTLQDPHGEGRVISDPRLIRRFMQQTRGVLELHWPRALVDWHEGLLVILLPRRAEGDGGEGPEELAHTLARRLLAATGPTMPGLTLTLALSRHQADPERLGSAIDEAQLALSIGEKLGRAGEVVTFEETGTYKLLFQVFADRPEELEAFYEQTMAPLVRYDEQYQTELVGTVSTYLDLDCNLAATAATLYTHRHTIRYRLDRIAELAGLDIGKTDDREKLSLGLKAMRLLGRRVTPPNREKPAHGTKAARGTKG